MIFQFEHVNLDFGPDGRWDFGPWNLAKLKQIMKKWQTGLEGIGWNALYLENHDQPRSVSRFGDPKNYPKASAKMLATFFMLMQGTPFIYQGQEIGMTNVVFNKLSEYRDVEIYNYYRERLMDGKDVEDTMRRISYRARDNARTPMQWNDSVSGGFTEGIPWIGVNPNYHNINVEQQAADPDSILNYYKELIKLRKANEALIYGKYDGWLEEHPEIFAYTRTFEGRMFLIVLNFYPNHPELEIPLELRGCGCRVSISNYSRPEQLNDKFKMEPYEAIVYELNPS
ncbi:glycosidase [Fontibacillus solani]|uniref:Glycosidase n=2 Tax=Fontibacillus solani TaxID=1572857 RepID=A0A7W3SY64_9BACL|nr:glycosidase [Fontibacillus solani]